MYLRPPAHGQVPPGRPGGLCGRGRVPGAAAHTAAQAAGERRAHTHVHPHTHTRAPTAPIDDPVVSRRGENAARGVSLPTCHHSPEASGADSRHTTPCRLPSCLPARLPSCLPCLPACPSLLRPFAASRCACWPPSCRGCWRRRWGRWRWPPARWVAVLGVGGGGGGGSPCVYRYRTCVRWAQFLGGRERT